VATLTEGTGVAYDSRNHVYLVVSANNTGAAGTVWARFIAANGTALGSQFLIAAPATYVHFPNVAFSPDAAGGTGGFIVAWHESDLPGFNTQVHTRMVAFEMGGPYGGENVVNSGATYWNIPIAIAYSTQSREFLLAWERVPGAGGYGIGAVRVDNNGAALAAPFAVAVNGQYEQWPSAAYNPVTNRFLVSYSAYDSVHAVAFVASRLVQAGTNSLIGPGATQLFGSVGTFITATVYNPRTNQFLVVWCWGTTAPSLTSGVLVNANGTVGGPVNLLSNRFAAADGLGVDYNPVTDTYFLVASTSASGSDGGVELVGSTGMPVDNGFLTTASAGPSGDPYPRIAASTDSPNWLICFSGSFFGADAQLVTGTPSSAPPPPPPGGSRPLMAVDAPTDNAVGSTTGFAISGWAADMGATSGTGVDAVAVWAYSNGAAPIMAGVANLGGARPDVAAAFGNPNLMSSGFGLIARLPVGGYTLAVYAHSTVNNSWNTPTLVHVVVQPPPSNPLMSVDLPGPNTIYTQAPGGIIVAGWAVDLAAASGPGVDAVHVWAFPQGSSTAVWVGWSPTGGARPDVGALFGSSQWSTSGFTVTGTLPAGNYTLVVYAHSTVTGTFNDVRRLSLPVR
jgi:hypothetical protein